MGFFSSKKKEEKKEIKKHVEIIRANREEKLEAEIEKKIEEGRIIKNIQYQMSTSENSITYSAMLTYDYWAEKARDEKEKGLELGR